MRRRSAITPPAQRWERDAPGADARSTNAWVLIVCSLAIYLPLRQALRVHRARAVPIVHCSVPTKKSACRLFLDKADSSRPHEGRRPTRPKTREVSHNACMRWKVLHGAGAVCRNRAKNVAIMGKRGWQQCNDSRSKNSQKSKFTTDYKVCMDRCPIVAWASSESHMSVQTQSRTSGMSSKCSRV